METPIVETQEIKVKRSYKPKDPEYFKKYYHSSGLNEKICCDLCSRLVSKQKMKRHQLSQLCHKRQSITI